MMLQQPNPAGPSSTLSAAAQAVLNHSQSTHIDYVNTCVGKFILQLQNRYFPDYQATSENAAGSSSASPEIQEVDLASEQLKQLVQSSIDKFIAHIRKTNVPNAERVISYIQALREHPLNEWDQITVYDENDAEIPVKIHPYCSLGLAILANFDDEKFYPEGASISVKQKAKDRELRLLSLFKCCEELASPPPGGVWCHTKVRHDPIYTLNKTYRDAEFIEVLPDYILELIQRFFESSLVIPQEAIFAILKSTTADVSKLNSIPITELIPHERIQALKPKIKLFLETMLRAKGLPVKSVEMQTLIDETLGINADSNDETTDILCLFDFKLTQPWMFQLGAIRAIKSETAPEFASSILYAQHLLATCTSPTDANFIRLTIFANHIKNYLKLENHIAHSLEEKIYVESSLVALRDYFNHFIDNEEQPFQLDVENDLANFRLTENFFALVNAADDTGKNSLFNRIIKNRENNFLSDDTLSHYSQLLTQTDGSIQLSVYAINRVLMHAFLFPIEKWSPLFVDCLQSILSYLNDQTAREQLTDVQRGLFASSYSPILLEFLVKLLETKNGNTTSEVQFQLVINAYRSFGETLGDCVFQNLTTPSNIDFFIANAVADIESRFQLLLKFLKFNIPLTIEQLCAVIKKLRLISSFNQSNNIYYASHILDSPTCPLSDMIEEQIIPIITSGEDNLRYFLNFSIGCDWYVEWIANVLLNNNTALNFLIDHPEFLIQFYLGQNEYKQFVGVMEDHWRIIISKLHQHFLMNRCKNPWLREMGFGQIEISLEEVLDRLNVALTREIIEKCELQTATAEKCLSLFRFNDNTPENRKAFFNAIQNISFTSERLKDFLDELFFSVRDAFSSNRSTYKSYLNKFRFAFLKNLSVITFLKENPDVLQRIACAFYEEVHSEQTWQEFCYHLNPEPGNIHSEVSAQTVLAKRASTENFTAFLASLNTKYHLPFKNQQILDFLRSCHFNPEQIRQACASRLPKEYLNAFFTNPHVLGYLTTDDVLLKDVLRLRIQLENERHDQPNIIFLLEQINAFCLQTPTDNAWLVACGANQAHNTKYELDLYLAAILFPFAQELLSDITSFPAFIRAKLSVLFKHYLYLYNQAFFAVVVEQPFVDTVCKVMSVARDCSCSESSIIQKKLTTLGLIKNRDEFIDCMSRHDIIHDFFTPYLNRLSIRSIEDKLIDLTKIAVLTEEAVQQIFTELENAFDTQTNRFSYDITYLVNQLLIHALSVSPLQWSETFCQAIQYVHSKILTDVIRTEIKDVIIALIKLREPNYLTNSDSEDSIDNEENFIAALKIISRKIGWNFAFKFITDHWDNIQLKEAVEILQYILLNHIKIEMSVIISHFSSLLIKKVSEFITANNEENFIDLFKMIEPLGWDFTFKILAVNWDKIHVKEAVEILCHILKYPSLNQCDVTDISSLLRRKIAEFTANEESFSCFIDLLIAASHPYYNGLEHEKEALLAFLSYKEEFRSRLEEVISAYEANSNKIRHTEKLPAFLEIFVDMFKYVPRFAPIMTSFIRCEYVEDKFGGGIPGPFTDDKLPPNKSGPGLFNVKPALVLTADDGLHTSASSSAQAGPA